MNYRQIEIFAAIMECRSITEAARYLGLSQPAVSKSLKSLEEELALRLFVRTARGLLVTDEGRELFAEASRVIMGFAHLDSFARDLGRLRHARIVISAMTALSLRWLPGAVAGFVHLYPDVSLEFRSHTSLETVRLVGQGEVDIGISQVRSGDMAVRRRKLFDLAAVCAVPAGHPLGGKSALRPEDFRGQTIVLPSVRDEYRRRFEIELGARGISVHSTIEATLGVTVCAMVEAGCGLGIVDVETARAQPWPGVVFRRLEPTIRVPVYVTHHGQKPLGLGARRFIEHIASHIPLPWGEGPFEKGLSSPGRCGSC